MKRYPHAWSTLAFFPVLVLSHRLFTWMAFEDDADEPGDARKITPYSVMGRATTEMGQRELRRMLWRIVGPANFIYVGSGAPTDNGARAEAELNALAVVGRAQGAAITRVTAEGDEPPSGRVRLDLDQAYRV